MAAEDTLHPSQFKGKTGRMIVGEHSSWELAHRDPAQDRSEALAKHADDYQALMHMHGLGYDMSQARVHRYTPDQ